MNNLGHLSPDTDIQLSKVNVKNYLSTRERNVKEKNSLENHHKHIERSKLLLERHSDIEATSLRKQLLNINSKTPSLEESLTNVKDPGKSQKKLFRLRANSLPPLKFANTSSSRPSERAAMTKRNRRRSLGSSSPETPVPDVSPGNQESVAARQLAASLRNYGRRMEHVTRSLQNLYKKISERDDEMAEEAERIDGNIGEKYERAKVILKNSKHAENIHTFSSTKRELDSRNKSELSVLMKPKSVHFPSSLNEEDSDSDDESDYLSFSSSRSEPIGGATAHALPSISEQQELSRDDSLAKRKSTTRCVRINGQWRRSLLH